MAHAAMGGPTRRQSMAFSWVAHVGRQNQGATRWLIVRAVNKVAKEIQVGRRAGKAAPAGANRVAGASRVAGVNKAAGVNRAAGANKGAVASRVVASRAAASRAAASRAAASKGVRVVQAVKAQVEAKGTDRVAGRAGQADVRVDREAGRGEELQRGVVNRYDVSRRLANRI
jgi:hypothetical protein